MIRLGLGMNNHIFCSVISMGLEEIERNQSNLGHPMDAYSMWFPQIARSVSVCSSCIEDAQRLYRLCGGIINNGEKEVLKGSDHIACSRGFAEIKVNVFGQAPGITHRGDYTRIIVLPSFLSIAQRRP